MRHIRLTASLLAGLLVCSSAGAQPPKQRRVPVVPRPATDADLETLAEPERFELLQLRGRLGYGADRVTDAGVAHIGRFKNLRVLALGGLELTDRSLAAIGKLERLESLSLDSNKITGAGLEHLTRLKDLRRLNLNFNPLSPDTLAVLPTLRGLTHLALYSTLPAADDALLERCSTLTALTELQLPEVSTGVTDRGLEHLSRLKHLRNLTLTRAKGVTDAGLARLAALEELQTLSLRELRAATPRGMDVLGKLTALRRLELESVAMDNAALRALASLKKLESFLLWNVANQPVTLDVLGELTALRSFRTNQAVPSSAIRALAKLDHLESITDELTEITDDDLKVLSRSPKLRVLVLGSEHVTAAALPSLAKMKALRDLYVTDKVRISPEQLTELGRTALPECRISRFRPPYTVFYRPSNDSTPAGFGR